MTTAGQVSPLYVLIRRKDTPAARETSNLPPRCGAIFSTTPCTWLRLHGNEDDVRLLCHFDFIVTRPQAATLMQRVSRSLARIKTDDLPFFQFGDTAQNGSPHIAAADTSKRQHKDSFASLLQRDQYTQQQDRSYRTGNHRHDKWFPVSGDAAATRSALGWLPPQIWRSQISKPQRRSSARLRQA